MLLRFRLLALLLTGPAFLYAQDTRCGTMDYLQLQTQKDPELPQRMAEIERFTQTYLQDAPSPIRDSNSEVITIPVVVHVVYANSPQNISDAQVQSQIDVLNEDFRRRNADTTTSNQWAQAADFGIEFCLANIDPDGLPTNGITRTATTVTTFGLSDAVKFSANGGRDAWPSDQYLNMWVCNLGNSLLGYAQFPGGDPATDGVVMTYQHFGRIGTASPPFHLGRTATHEVGHWLNLRHIWGDGGCGVDDFVDDTPLSDAPNYGCATGHVSCNSVDMVENYMDYGNDACLTAFTAGQRARSMALFAPGGARQNLPSANVCCPPSTCPRIATVDLESLNDSTILLAWPAVDSQATYYIRYRPEGDSAWVEGFSTTAPQFALTQLGICTTYEIQLTSACALDSNDYCVTFRAATLGCCEPPAEARLLLSAATIAQVNWQAAYGVNEYELRYRAFQDTGWTSTFTPDTFAILSGLEACTGYIFQVKSRCDTLTQDFSPEVIFYTRGCESCTSLDYCTPSGNSNLLWIARVQLGALDWSSAADAGYANQSNFSSPLYLDSLNTVLLQRGGSLSADHDWAIWLDLNRDGTFDDLTERVFTSGPVSGDSLIDVLYLPDSLAAGRTRMRVGARITAFGGNTAMSSCGTIAQGEYEDYCVELRYRCRQPEALSVQWDSLGQTYTATWPAYAFSTSYVLRYRALDDSLWTEIALADTLLDLPATSLNPCQAYQFEVSSTCAPDQSAYTAADTLLTRCTTGLPAALARQVRLYPNPTQGRWTVTAPVAIEAVRIVDLMGRTCYAQSGHGPVVEMQTGPLPAGLYLIEVQTAAGRIVKRLQYE